jgi:calcineurin-like phosphoesterase family protein
MRDVLIERWNSVIRPGDTVYHLGDFCFGKESLAIAQFLNGKKRLVLGNHDVYPVAEYLKYFDKVYGALFWKKCLLTHIPVHPSSLGVRTLINIHGHTHSRDVMTESGYVDYRYFNVSVDRNFLTPIHADVILDRM